MVVLTERSWLFNIIDRDTQQVEESWTLVIPPQKYSIKEGTQSQITRTFQRVFIDDYGPDHSELSISGFSGASHAYPTFRTVGNDGRRYRDKEAFYEFRDRILQYRYRADYEKKLLYVYDLSDEQSYNCHLVSFGLDRSHETPFKYPYSIELFVINRLNDKGPIPSAAFLPDQSANNDASVVESLDQAEIAANSVGKAISNDDIRPGFSTDPLVEFDESDQLLLEFASRGGSYHSETTTVETATGTSTGSAFVLDYPEGEFSDAEIAHVERVLAEKRRVS